MYIFKKILYFIFCKLFFNVKFVNKSLNDNIERCVICSNHVGSAEAFMIFSVTNNIATMAKAELFENKILAKIFLYFGIFPIHRGEKDARSILHAVNIFKKSKYNKLLIFPEGTRVKEGERIEAKIGAVYIAMKAGVPILPVKIINKNNRKIFSNFTIIFGDPINLSIDKIKDKQYLETISNTLMDNIYNLKEI